MWISFVFCNCLQCILLDCIEEARDLQNSSSCHEGLLYNIERVKISPIQTLSKYHNGFNGQKNPPSTFKLLQPERGQCWTGLYYGVNFFMRYLVTEGSYDGIPCQLKQQLRWSRKLLGLKLPFYSFRASKRGATTGVLEAFHGAVPAPMHW